MKKKKVTKKKVNKTTPEHFNIFKKECEKWIQFFGLYEYNYLYRHTHINNALAMTSMNDNRSDRKCTLSLNTSWGDNEITDYKLREAAFHEICEVLLWDIGDKLCDSVGQNIERNLVHKVICILENTVFKKGVKNV